MADNKQDRIRDAATLVLVRDAASRPQVLMGQRGESAAFMPMKFVFPGGAVDAGDAGVPLAGGLPAACAARLAEDADPRSVPGLYAAAIRELWEETGLVLGTPAPWPGPPPEGWESFAASGHVPSARGLAFVFRAITPPGRTRRFDARFFLADAAALASDPDDFSHATGELSHLQWVPLELVRSFDLPFITQVVLAEIATRLPDLSAPQAVPFICNRSERTEFRWLEAGKRD